MKHFWIRVLVMNVLEVSGLKYHISSNGLKIKYLTV